MVFSSLFFLFVFLPLNLLFYYLCPSLKIKNYILILFSLFFYAWGEPVWIILLVFSATIDYYHGKIIESNRNNYKKKLALVSSLVLNISLLAFFKYSSFIVENINFILGSNFKSINYGLPIGISFYTFQTLSYTIDVYKGRVKAQQSYHKFLLFVSLFHQLVAGPIVRYRDIANEIENRKLNLPRFNKGIMRFVTGLCKKVLIANTAGNIASFYLDNSFASLTVFGAWYGICLFSLQIYFDFSGYSDMAIGLGDMFGFTYKENFNYPYISKSVTEFWRRWHISLGSFFRDYVYIPLGGNRTNRYRNLIIVWLLTGLWHGSSWNFVLWGLYFGILIAIEKIFLSKVLCKLPVFLNHAYLIFIVVTGWVLFYYSNLSKCVSYLKIMFFQTEAAILNASTILRFKNNIFFFLIAIVLSTPMFKVLTIKIKQYLSCNRSIYIAGTEMIQVIYVGLALIICSAFLLGQSYNPFLYFRF